MKYNPTKLTIAKRKLNRWKEISQYNKIIPSPKKNEIKAYQLDCNLKRIYSVSDNSLSKVLSMGGRFYGANYQQLNKDERKLILIDFERTVELDYSALHIRMLYNSKGINYDGDPYQIPDYPEEARGIIKKALNIMINSKNFVQAKCSLRNTINKDEEMKRIWEECIKKSYYAFLSDLKTFHSAIAEFFHSDKGIELQNYDSNIAFEIMKQLMKKKILVLIIHDSFIVQRRHKKTLKKVMINQYKKIFHYPPVIK